MLSWPVSLFETGSFFAHFPFLIKFFLLVAGRYATFMA